MQVEISIHPPESQGQSHQDQRFLGTTPKSPLPRLALSCAPFALDIPQQPHQAEGPPGPLPVRGADNQLQGCAASQWSGDSPMERAYTCNMEQPPCAPGTSLRISLAAPWTEGSYISLAGNPCPLLILGEHPYPCQASAAFMVFCSSQPHFCLSPPNHSHCCQQRNVTGT